MPLPLVLLPGLDGTGILFRPFLAALPPHIRPTVITYPGDRHLTYAELLPLIRNALPRNESFVLLGESFSGPLAAMVAAERPAGLAGLILCATFVTKPWKFVSPAVPLLVRSAPFRLFPRLQRLRSRLEGYASRPLDDLFAEMHTQVQPHVLAARVRMVFKVDARDALRSCGVPVMYMQADRDRVVPAWHARLAAQLNPQIQVKRFACAHLLLQTRPAEAAQAVAEFAESLTGPERLTA